VSRHGRRWAWSGAARSLTRTAWLRVERCSKWGIEAWHVPTQKGYLFEALVRVPAWWPSDPGYPTAALPAEDRRCRPAKAYR